LLQRINVEVEVRDRIANGYLRGTTYLWTPFFWIISVVTLFVVGAEAVSFSDGHHKIPSPCAVRWLES